GSDAPVESPNPFIGLHAAVNRTRPSGYPGSQGWYPEQRISLEQALAGYTTGAAYAAGLENFVGQLRPGFYADLILLSEDPFVVLPETLHNLHPTATMVAGEWVWRH
ncbi:amidohydrolase, partial [bacterium]